MTIIPIPQFNNQSNDRGLSNKSLTALLIVLNFVFLISFGVLYYLFTKESYVGTFWDWSWDLRYSSFHDKSNAGNGMFVWISVFVFDGVAIMVWLVGIVERMIGGEENTTNPDKV